MSTDIPTPTAVWEKTKGTALARLAATAKKLKVSEITVKRRLADYRAAHPEVTVPEFKKRNPK